jgi:cardiolipin synthase
MLRRRKSTADPTTEINRAQLIRGGKPYFDAVLELINGAQSSLHIQTYIFDDDATGRMVVDAMKAAVRRGVNVYLLADGYASQVLSRDFINEIKDAGIHFRYFEPFFRSKHFYFGRRLHHKLVVADVQFGLVGGMNITDRYNDMEDQEAWLDFAVLVEGEIAKSLCILCWKTWYGFKAGLDITPCEKLEVTYEIPKAERVPVRMRRNDWVLVKNEISETYVQMLREATSHITILCAYFLPGHTIQNNLRYAVSRGVKIKVIIAGRSDVPIAKRAERWFYDWLLRYGIELYEYQKNVLHGKLATADDQWTTIGSYNINDLSAYASIELNLDIFDKQFAKHTRETLEEIIERDCIRITKERNRQSRNIFGQFLNWLSYRLMRVLFHLFTFYFKQHR